MSKEPGAGEVLANLVNSGAAAFVAARSILDKAWKQNFDAASGLALTAGISDPEALDVILPRYPDLSGYKFRSRFEFVSTQASSVAIDIRFLNLGYRARYSHSRRAESAVEFGVIATRPPGPQTQKEKS